jgi:hypothetical protein
MGTSNNSSSFLEQSIKTCADKKVWVAPTIEVIDNARITSGISTTFNEGTRLAKTHIHNSYVS